MRKPTQRPVWRILCAWFTGLLLADLVLMRLRTADVAANVRISDEREAAVDTEQTVGLLRSGRSADQIDQQVSPSSANSAEITFQGQ